MRWIVCFVLIAAAWNPTAWAQMAAPSLIPGTASAHDPLSLRDPTLLPINPAVMSWREYSTGGGGVSRSELRLEPIPEDDKPGQTTPVEINFGGVQRVGTSYSWGVQVMNGAANDPESTTTFEAVTLAGAYRWNDWLATGVGYATFTQKVSSESTEITDLKLGASLRLAEDWYLGAVAYEEKYARKYGKGSGDNWSSTQQVTGYGVAYRNQGPWQFHVELWSIDYGTAVDKENETIVREKQSHAVFEVAHEPWVAGMTVGNASRDLGEEEAPVTFESNSYELTFGVVPKNGFALLFYYGYTHMEVQAELKVEFNDFTRGMSLIYVF